VDQLVFAMQQDTQGALGNGWSGVYVKPGLLSNTYGVLWGAPVSALFGYPPSEEHPDGDPSVVLENEILDENGESNWGPLPEPEPVDEWL
jgi:hypothetical protein